MTQAVGSYVGGATRRSVLPGGLRVVSEKVPSSHSFTIGIFIGVGSRHESDHLHGASHFLEHVLFKGTPTRTAEQISAAIEEVGGDINAYTAKEHTCFHARVLSSDAALATEVLVDMLTHSLVVAEDFEAEREVILDEIAMHADEPGEQVADAAAARLWAGHPLGRNVIGSVGSIRSLSRDQVLAFLRRHYRSSEIVVAAAGDVDHDALVGWVAELDELGTGQEARRRIAPDPDYVPGVSLLSRDSEQCTVSLALPGFDMFDERRFAAGVLSTVLGGGMSSRLFVEVRERRGLSYSIWASEGSHADAGMVTVDWQCLPDRVGLILPIVRDEIARLLDDGVGADELRRAQGQLRGQTVLSFESPWARMSRLGTAELIGDERSVSDLIAGFEAVTAEDVLQVAREVFSPTPFLVSAGPTPQRRQLNRLIEDWQRAMTGVG